MRKYPLGRGGKGGKGLLSFFFSSSEEAGEKLGESGGWEPGDGGKRRLRAEGEVKAREVRESRGIREPKRRRKKQKERRKNEKSRRK